MDKRLATEPRRIFTNHQSCFYFLAFFILQTCTAYNLEPRLPLFKYGPRGSNFGFSVAQHRTSTNDQSGIQDTLLVAGAPTANALPNQDTKRPGGIFYCPVSTDPLDCTRVVMDKGGDDSSGGIKSGQWLGVSLKSQGPGGFLISCAHRWRQHLYAGEKEIERICGKCFLLNGTSDHTIVEIPPDDPSLSPGFISSPCDRIRVNLQSSKKLYRVMQAGTSLDMNNDHYMLGAPGAWAWTGAVFDLKLSQEKATDLSILLQYDEPMIESPKCSSGADWPASGVKCNNIPLNRDSYMGFSVATSNAVETDSNAMYYAAGAPRGNLTGAVIMLKKKQNDIESYLGYEYVESVVGPMVSSSFGFSVALTDINADGLDDLIVGAPQYYQYSNEGKIGGAVYIYMNPSTRGFREVTPRVLYGPLDSFFGYSIAPLGDIDQDGFNDFAVGAPYEEENGVVHIYRGSDSGEIKESQALKGKDYPFVKRSGNGDIVGFGTALSGRIDADSNKYPDLLVGTLSDHISLFRSRPVISVEMKLNVRQSEIDLDNRNCTYGGKLYSCFKLRFCFKYKARHDEYTEDVALKYNLALDTTRTEQKKSSRVHYKTPNGTSEISDKVILPRAGENICPGRTHTVYFNNDAEDKLSPIGVHFDFDLDSKDVVRERIKTPVFSMIDDPILDADFAKKSDKTVLIKNSCGSDGCQSNLMVDADMPKEIVVADDKIVTVTINVGNDAEEAHQAFVTLTIPPKVNFHGFSATRDSGSRIQCYDARSGLTSFVRCDLGNPYKPGSQDTIKVELDASQLTADDKQMEVQIAAQTTSENPVINPIMLQAKVIIELELSLTAQSLPQQILYKEDPILGQSAMKSTAQIGPAVQYTFNVKNEANQGATGVSLVIQLPYEINNGKWLVYLISADVKSGAEQTGTCEVTGEGEYAKFNPVQIHPDSSFKRKRRYAENESPSYQPIAQASTSGGNFQSVLHLSCKKKNANCVKISCTLDKLNPGTTSSVIVQGNIWEATFLEEFKKIDLVYIYTGASLESENENVRFKGNKTSDQAKTTVDHDFFRSDVSSTFPWWYILIAVIITLIIYILIMVVLIKCGFFKRKKFHEREEENKLIREEMKDNERDIGESNL